MKPLLLAIPGIVLLSWSLIDQTGQFIGFCYVGIELIVISMALVMIAKPTYAVQIGGASGDNSILRSTDIAFVQRVVDAMNRALAREK